MEALIRTLLANVAVWTLLLALLLAALQTRRAWRLDRWAEASLLWISFWVLGIGGLYGFVAHLAFGPFLAEQIGWPNSPSRTRWLTPTSRSASWVSAVSGIAAGTTCWQPWLLTEAGFLPTVTDMLCLCWWKTTTSR